MDITDTLEKVKELRARTNASLSLCRRLIEQTGGDIEKSIEAMKKNGEIKAADKAGRIATQGKLHTYVHGNGSKVALVEINCETDFAGRSSEFNEFCDLVGMQIVGMSPLYIRRSDVPEADVKRQSLVFFSQIPEKIKAEAAREKIFTGKMDKWYSEICLLEQDCAALPGITIEKIRIELVAKIGENVNVRRFVRWELGEGIEKKQENYLEEVAKLTGAPVKPECYCGAPSCDICHP